MVHIFTVLDRLTVILFKISIQTKSINLGYALPASKQNWKFLIQQRASLSSAKTGSAYNYLPATHQNKSLLILSFKMMKIHIKKKKEKKIQM